MEINKIKYFDTEISMVILDDLAVGEIESDKYLVESSNGFLDVMSADECKEVYSVDPNEIIK